MISRLSVISGPPPLWSEAAQPASPASGRLALSRFCVCLPPSLSAWNNHPFLQPHRLTQLPAAFMGFIVGFSLSFSISPCPSSPLFTLPLTGTLPIPQPPLRTCCRRSPPSPQTLTRSPKLLPRLRTAPPAKPQPSPRASRCRPRPCPTPIPWHPIRARPKPPWLLRHRPPPLPKSLPSLTSVTPRLLLQLQPTCHQAS